MKYQEVVPYFSSLNLTVRYRLRQAESKRSTFALRPFDFHFGLSFETAVSAFVRGFRLCYPLFHGLHGPQRRPGDSDAGLVSTQRRRQARALLSRLEVVKPQRSAMLFGFAKDVRPLFALLAREMGRAGMCRVLGTSNRHGALQIQSNLHSKE